MSLVPLIEFEGQTQELKPLTLIRKFSGLSAPHIVIVIQSICMVTWFALKNDRPVAAWALDELSGIWCKPNISSEHGDHSAF